MKQSEVKWSNPGRAGVCVNCQNGTTIGLFSVPPVKIQVLFARHHTQWRMKNDALVTLIYIWRLTRNFDLLTHWCLPYWRVVCAIFLASHPFVHHSLSHIRGIRIRLYSWSTDSQSYATSHQTETMTWLWRVIAWQVNGCWPTNEPRINLPARASRINMVHKT